MRETCTQPASRKTQVDHLATQKLLKEGRFHRQQTLVKPQRKKLMALGESRRAYVSLAVWKDLCNCIHFTR